MKLKIHYFLIILFVCVTIFGYAQQKTIAGTVNSEGGQPLSGASIVVKGTNISTLTDEYGRYTIVAELDQTLVISYVGFQTQEVPVANNNFINVNLLNAASDLDEVIVVGYGTQSKRKLTDNVAKLTSSDISQIPSPGFQSLLSGKAAGVQVMQTNGKVEAGISMRIRGVASIGAGSQPLYVLDGMPLINQNESNNSAPQNPLLTLSPNEIASIDILKDASATAIYGSRGANGVVVITTKKGQSGRSSISANVSHGWSGPANKREWLNAAEYKELLQESLINRYGTESGTQRFESFMDNYSAGTDWRNGEVDTDWQDLAFQDGYLTDADLSMSGGNDKTTYFLSGAYNGTKGIIRGNELERLTSRINVSHNFSDKFTGGANLSFSKTSIDRIANDNAFVTPLQAVALSPISPAYLPDGEPNGNTIYANFLLQDRHAFYNTVIRRVTGKAFGEYRFLPYLKFNTDFGYDLYYQTEDSYTGRLAPFQSTNGEGYASSVGTESYITSNYFTYSQNFANIHDLEAVVGMEFNDTRRRFQSVTGIEFPTDDFQTIGSAAEITAGNGNVSQYNFLSYFVRATYSLKDRYLLKASVRRDGSSRFGESVRYGTFAAASAGWILSEEDFLSESEVVSFLKLRGSWGQSGNAEIGDFASLGLYGGISYNQRPGISPTQPANSFLTWEKVNQYDIGVDFGFLNNRLSGELDYYVKQSKDLLFDVPLPGTSGFSTITRNIGLMENRGVEFVLNTENIKKEGFTWNTSINIARNNNEVKELPNGADVISGRNIVREGEAINSFYVLEYAGVSPDNGDALYYLNSKNEDGTLSKETTNDPNRANRIVAGSPIPVWIGGFTSALFFKGFDFSFTFQGEWGASIYNAGGLYQSANGDYYDNQSRDQLRRWRQPGDITDVPQARFGLGNGTAHSTRYLERTDFIRLRNVNLGYTIPQQALQQLGINNLRVYLAAFNLLTFTDYQGYDPEARSDAGETAAGNGIDFYSAPAARTFSLGVNFNF
ncbi:TonB-dependent receptor [Parapedobacter sp. ISTM3]|uniref:TonB-linked outer membrane protein, SusC/RagA family n=1 Tax=Parapedobacter luteus TaxID=623280 RepID=A0A1T5EVN4_9SPHI|nr:MULTISPECIES: TonB-dependent receptor [Parapedobacter]MBK1441633.1 TonB-dependent receptor [Parapedobacter sp. ISTM3]SKB88007.1 TonB-linked outer membrane protein, SusC/RagA family [Parapedobacter luteus]